MLILPSLCVLGVFVTLWPSFLASAQGKDGFLGYEWGTPLAEMKEKFDLQNVTQRGDYRQYSCNVRSIDGAELKDCDLEFYGESFSGVIITTSGRGNSRRLLEFLKRAYGEGHRDATVAYQWLSPDTHISYDEDSAGDAYIYWYYLKSEDGQEH